MSVLGKIDIWLVISYMMVLLFMGAILVFRNKTPKQFLIADGKMSANLIAFSIFGTYFSNIGFFGIVGKAFGQNTSWWTYSLMAPVAALIGSHLFVKFYRSKGYTSAFTHLTERFGRWATVFASVTFTFYALFRNGLITYLVGMVLQPLTGWDIRYLILMTGGVVLVYVYLGGIEAAIKTDFVQSILMYLAVICCIGYLLYRIPLNPIQSFEYAWQANKFTLGSLSSDFSKATFWVLAIDGIVGNVANLAIGQSYVQRFLTAESDKAAKQGVLRGSFLITICTSLFFITGTLLYVFYQTTPHSQDVLDAIAKRPDSAFPTFILKELPFGLKGIILIGVFAAAMSTISTYLQSVSTVFYENYYKPIIRKNKPISDSEGMRVLHITSTIVGVVIMMIAMSMSNIRSIVETSFQWTSFFEGGILGLFLIGFCYKYVTSKQAALALILGIIALIGINAPTIWPNFPFKIHLHFMLNTAVCIAIMLVFGFFADKLAKMKKDSRSR